MKNSRLADLTLHAFISIFFIVGPLFAQTPNEIKKGSAAQVQAAGVNLAPEHNESIKAPNDFVTLDFKDADIRNVLKIISYKSGINIVATPEVMGNVTIRLVGVQWEKALDTIVKTQDFGYEWLNDKVIMVSTLEKLSQQRKARQEAEVAEPVDTQTFVLNYSRAQDIKNALEKLVSTRGNITLESRTNTVIITDIKSNLLKIGEIIRQLDKMTPQVMIEAKIIETSLGSTDKLGIDWTLKIAASGAKRPTTLPFEAENIGTGRNFLPKVQVPSELRDVTTTTYNDAGVAINTTTEQKTFSKLSSGFPAVSADQFIFGTLDFSTMQVVMEFLKARVKTRILSNPRITTLNNQEARMMVGKVVPIPTYAYSKETGNQVISGYQDMSVGVKLIVTPYINEHDYITLNVNPSVDDIIGTTGPNGERPVISTRSADTKVMIKDGQTLVIGGLISENKINSRKAIPFLGEIPILNLIFGSKEGTVNRTELLIFITPHIIKEADFARSEELLKDGDKTQKPVSKNKKQ
ncbi:MAG: hypothetical protein NTU54_04215 [Candidatus Omnitrophica bacterium]|nr:hypothetical protein [Candidatus Omnitrophota bacterium]